MSLLFLLLEWRKKVMIIVLKANTPKEEAKKLVDAIKAKGLQVDIRDRKSVV